MAKKKGLAGVPIAPLIIIVIGIVVVLYILKNKNLFNFGPIVAPAVATNPLLGDKTENRLSTDSRRKY